MPMRGHDPHTGEFFSPSRSQQRRDALQILNLAETLVGLPPARLNALVLNDILREHISVAQRISAHGARKRQLGFIAKQLRGLETDALQHIQTALQASTQTTMQQNAMLHQAEHWRQRLLESDQALTEFLNTYPDIDRQSLRNLVRRARVEKSAATSSSRAARELFQLLRRILEDMDTAS